MLDKVIDIAKNADIIVMEIYNRYLKSDIKISYKTDKSPLTEADLPASEYICEKLKKLDSSIPIICEETKKVSFESRKEWKRFWLVDPVDGTKEFINRNGEFTINIGLIENGVPILGVVSVPCQNLVYYGCTQAKYCDGIVGSFVLNKIGNQIRELKCNGFNDGDKINVACSRSHINQETEDYMGQFNVNTKIRAGSSLKFMMLCENKVQLYPRLGPTMEWDIAASHAILNSAGGSLKLCNGERMEYNKENLRNPYFIASVNN